MKTEDIKDKKNAGPTLFLNLELSSSPVHLDHQTELVGKISMKNQRDRNPNEMSQK